jgi:two-component system nitrogen regulation sensor histidine kinase NtrY
LGRWRRERRVRTAATLGLVVLGPVLAALTYFVLGPLDQGASSPRLRIVLLADLVYVLGIAALVAREVARMVAAGAQIAAGPAAPSLVGVFALLALIPTVTVAVFSVLTINVASRAGSPKRVRAGVSNSWRRRRPTSRSTCRRLARDGRSLAPS